MTFKAGDLVTVATHTGERPAHYVRPLGRRLNLGDEYHLVTLIYPSRVGTQVGKKRSGRTGNSALYVEGKPRRFHKSNIEKARTCRVCGCSEFFACIDPVFAPDGTIIDTEPCHWADKDLCSRCI